MEPKGRIPGCARRLPLLAVLVGLLSAGATSAQQLRQVRVDFRQTVLANGLRVITVEDHSAPVVAVAVTYDVGSRVERPGRTGFAHLFEHMMFKGSRNVGSGEHFVLVFNNGGTMNGTTSEDRTNYFQALPANQLELALFLESDRMRSLEITQENLDNQRSAVQEERRRSVDNQAYGRSSEAMQELLYDSFAYAHPVIGSMEDLNAATIEDVRAFFRTYYAPNNAVLTLVGDFSTARALAMVRRYFEDIPRQPAPPPLEVSEGEQKEERRAAVEDPLARLARLDIAFKAVPGNTPDFYALQVLAATLAGGQSSRLYQKLVRETELATGVGAFMDEKRGPGALYVSATVRPGKRTEDVEAVVYRELEFLARDPIAGWELEKARNSARRAFIGGLQSSLRRATLLGQYAVYYGDAGLINARLERSTAVSPADVQRVAGHYLKPSNRTVVVTTPARRGGGAPAEGAP